jgi:tetratricopeptide (TPR) repeat protein
MSHKFKSPKPTGKKLKQMPLPLPRVRIGPPLPNMEKAHQVIGKLAKEGNFQSVEELNAHLEQLMASGELDRMLNAAPEGPVEQAQTLVQRAREEPSMPKARKLAEQALKLDPNCVDAMLVRAQTRKLSEKEYIEELRAAVLTGERSLGEARFREDRGRFWGLVETRPYMRARSELAMALNGAGRSREAAEEFAAMLELNPNDNQGVRDYLLGLYLALSELDRAAGLFRQYEEDGTAVFAWGRVFLLMLSGKRAEAVGALEQAFRTNPWTAKVLFSGNPPADPPSWGIGDQDEGEHAAVALLPAVIEHPDIVVWMAKESVDAMKRIMDTPARRRAPRVH